MKLVFLMNYITRIFAYLMAYQILEDKCFKFFESFSKHDSIDVEIINSLHELIETICIDNDYSHLSVFLDPDSAELLKILKTLKNILHVEFSYVYSNGSDQEIRMTTFYDMLLEISKEHIHHKIHNQKLYVCDGHQESLFSHLILAMLISLARVFSFETFEKKLTQAFIGLVHDIGKKGTADIVAVGGQNNTKFKFHGEMGSGILLMAWNNRFEQFFSKSDWQDIARTVCIHMNGNNESTEKPSVLYKWFLLRLENDNVKKYLYYLSCGDTYGRIKKNILNNVKDFKIFEDSRDIFMNNIIKSFDPESFAKAYSLDKILILIRGTSGSGKSTLTSLIENKLNELRINMSVIERDAVICSIVSQKLKEEVNVPLTGEAYKKYYKYYKNNNLKNEVNEAIKEKITQELLKKNIVIFDSVISLFNLNDVIPSQLCSNTFIIAVDTIRCKLLTSDDADRRGALLKKQVKMHGERSQFNWLPEITKPRFNQFSSLSASKYFAKNDYLRPRLVYTVAWNDDLIGYDTFISQLLNLTPLVQINLNLPCDIDKKIINDKKIDDKKKEVKNKINLPSYLDNKTAIMNIVTFVNHIYKIYGYDDMFKIFKENNFKIGVPSNFKNTIYSNRVIKIKYLEHCNLWQQSWARQCRGVILMLDNNIWTCIKYQFPRGAEILTGLHVKAGIEETESVHIKNIENLDICQQDTIKKLLNNQQLSGYMSFKNDGSLLGICLYYGKYYDEIKKIIDITGTELSKLILEMSIEMNLPFIPILNSQTTFFLNEEMEKYMVTAIAGEYGITNINDVTPIEVFKTFGRYLLVQLKVFYETFRKKYKKYNVFDVMILNFEAICKGRLTLWKTFHTELTQNYTESGIKLLGCSFASDIVTFIPHFQFSDVIYESKFKEPLYWKISHACEVEKIFTNLTLCIRNKITRAEFLKIHVPDNKFMSFDNVNILKNFFDFEGFVFYRKFGNFLSYSKIKTEEFYKSHKFKIENVKYLVDLSNNMVQDIFPLARAVNNFFSDCKEKFTKIIKLCYNELLLPKDQNLIFQGLPEKAKISFDKQKSQTQARMLLNASSTSNEILYSLFIKEMPELKTCVVEKSVISDAIRKLLMSVEPWVDDFEIRLNNLITSHDVRIFNFFSFFISS